MKEVVIVAALRTPIGCFLGALSRFSAIDLGSIVLENVIKKNNLYPDLIEEVFFGNVLQAGLGQSPTRQVSIKSGIPYNVPCTTINRVCSSGIKSVIIGVQSILSGDNNVVAVGGMESMSQVPFYLSNLRVGNKLGHKKIYDGLLYDGLIDVYNKQHMGLCAEFSSEKYQISRMLQDEFAIESYKRSKIAWEQGKFNDEIVPIIISKKQEPALLFKEDEEYKNINFDKIYSLPTVFKENGTITVANASKISDGAAALILMSQSKSKELSIKPLAKIISYADVANKPLLFTTTPAKAIFLALKKSKLSIHDIDFFEINEAFSVVTLINQKLLGINLDKINIHGGAVSLGHPIGASGSRILVTLINVLKQKNVQFGALGICNGGGGGSALIIENLN